jgi:ribonuclease BN (tRNA processing enzyme)
MKFIDIFNVKHGDFGVYYNTDQNYSCILDCGTSQPNSCLHTNCLTPSKLINLVSYQISSFSNSRDILISHYHQDHYNGIHEFKKYGLPFFRKMYVPYIDFTAKYSKQLLYSMCLLEATSDLLKIPFNMMKNFSSLFLEEYAQEKFTIHRKDILENIKDSTGSVAEVIWPPKQIYDRESKALCIFINRLESVLHKHELGNAIKKTKKYFSELEKQITQKKFSSLDSDNKNLEDQEENKTYDINEISCTMEYNEEKEKTDDSKNIKAAFSKLRNAVKTFLNALSIVLKIDNKVIWMGDVTEEVLKILSKDIEGDYVYFKLPHHGTIDISHLNISTSKFVVSLSDGNKYKTININNIKKALDNCTYILCTDGHRNCYYNFFPFHHSELSHPILYPFCEKVYCSRNTVVRLDF